MPLTTLLSEPSPSIAGDPDHPAQTSRAVVLMTWLDHQRDRLPLWVPVLLGIGVGGYFALPEEPSGWLIWPALAMAIMGVVVIQGVARYALISVCVVILGLAAAQLRTITVATPVIHTGTRVLPLAGTVVALDGRRDQPRVVLALEQSPAVRFELPHRIRLVWRGELVPRVGDRVEGRARLLPSPGPAEPGGYDFARNAYFRSIGAIGVPTRDWQIVGTGAAPLAAALRQTIRERLNAAMAQPARGLALAIFTGERDLIAPETRAQITQAGLAHLLAISGLHIGLVAGLVFWGLRRGVALVGAAASIIPTKKVAALAGAFAAIGYTVLVDAPVSAQRACLMTVIVMLAIILDRAAISLRVVAVAAVLILVCWPEAVLTPGFQLSFAASAALIAFYEALGPMRNAVGDDVTMGWRFLSWLSSLLASSLVAGLVTLPITWFHFNEIVNYGLLGNLIGVPIFSFWVMPAGVLAMVLMPMGLEAPPLWLMNLGLDVLLWFADWVASLPGSVVHPVAPGAIAMLCMTFGALWLVIWRGRVRWGGFVAIGLGLLLAWQGMAPTSIRITGDRQALAIRLPDGRMFITPNASDYQRSVWARRAGVGETAALSAGTVANWPTGQLACDRDGCVLQTSSTTLALPFTVGAWRHDCGRVGYILSAGPPPLRCDGSVVINPPAFERAVARLALTGDGFTMTATGSDRRPWHPRAPR